MLRAFAEGAPPLTYVWSVNGAAIAGATEATLAFPAARTADTGSYAVRVTAADGTSASSGMNLAVTTAVAGAVDERFGQPFLLEGSAGAIVQADGRLVLDGTGTRQATTGAPPAGAVRFDLTGAVDTAFPLRGLALTAIALRPDAAVWVGGPLGGTGNRGVALLRPDYSIDPSFQPPAATVSEAPLGLAPVPGGGVGVVSRTGDRATVRVLRADGSPDPAFNNGNPLVYQHTSSANPLIAVTPDRWVYLASITGNFFGRYRPDGTRDASFEPLRLWLVPSFDGRVYLLGSLPGAPVVPRRVFRVGAGGAIDSAFNDPGTSSWSAAAVDARGRVWGVYLDKFLRLRDDGALDPSFAAAGNFNVRTTGSVAVNAEGTHAYLVGGTRAGTPPLSGFVHVLGAGGGGPAQLVNLSTRARAGTGDDSFIVGFVTVGTANSDLLVRAIGPGLADFGIANQLTAARLEIFRGATVGETNEQWNSNPALAGVMAAAGAFALRPANRDAALLLNLAPNAYTAVITPAGTAPPGIALAEIYDTRGASAAPAVKLINIASRGRAGAADDALIAGFVLAGSGARSLLVRAIGPGQRRFGVSGVLDEPSLAIFQGSTELFRNQAWDDVAFPEITAAAARRANAFPLERAAHDAALVVRLDPGSYTAKVSGSSAAAAGIALIEVYEIVE